MIGAASPDWEYTPWNMVGHNPRGETFWTDGKSRRLLVARGSVLDELDADTGKLIPGFLMYILF
jgi:hypothetical protein